MAFNVLISDDDPVTLFLHQVMVKKSELSAYPLSFSSGGQTNMPEVTGWQLPDTIQIEPDADRICLVMALSSIESWMKALHFIFITAIKD